MENAQIIDILHIAFLEIKRDAVFLSQEMQGIEGFSLGLCDGRDTWVSWGM